jgi:hypothetical protein
MPPPPPHIDSSQSLSIRTTFIFALPHTDPETKLIQRKRRKKFNKLTEDIKSLTPTAPKILYRPEKLGYWLDDQGIVV